MSASNFLYVNQCGCNNFFNIETGSLRPDGKTDYHILYIARGSCFATFDGKTIEVKEGSIVLYLPFEHQEYIYKKGIKAKSYFVHFDGEICRELFKNYDERIIYIGKNTKVEALLDTLVKEFHLKMSEYENVCASLLLNIISLVTRHKNNVDNSLNSDIASNAKIIEVCAHMRENTDKNLKVCDLAKMCNLSVSRFAHLFKSVIGVSPQQYVLDIKIQKSKELLENTGLPILTISEMMGMQSQHYFCKFFKKHTSFSPTEYRKMFK